MASVIKIAAGCGSLLLFLIFSTFYFTNQKVAFNPKSLRDLSSVEVDDRPKFTFDDIFGSKFSYDSISPRWISDTEYIFSDPERNVFIRNATSMADEVIMNGSVYSDNAASAYKVSSTQEYILLLTNYKKGWRHSYNGTYLVFNVSSQKMLDQATLPDDIQYITWSPQGNALLYVKNFDIYYREEPTGDDFSITNDGRANHIYNGIPDWVYEEDMISGNNVIYFSPDGSKVAFAQFNDTDCDHIEFIRYGKDGQQYPTLVDVSYPKTGTTQPTSKVFICDVSSITDLQCEEILPQQSLIDNGDYLFNRVAWANDTRAAVMWCDRVQTWSVMSMCDYVESSRSWNCFQLPQYEHRVDKGWLYQRKPYWIPVFGKTEDEFFKVLPNDKWQHVARIDNLEEEPEFQTEGSYTVTSESAAYPSLYFYEPKSDYIYFLATLGDPGKRQVYRVKGRVPASNIVECVSCIITIDHPNRCDFVTASFSVEGSYVVLQCRGVGAPLSIQYRVNHTDTDPSQVFIEKEILASNNDLFNAIETTQMSNVSYGTFQSKTGYDFHYQQWNPPNFDSTKSYPLLIDVYAGPGFQNVDYRWTRSWAPRYVPVGLETVVVRVDGRGSNFHGDTFMYEVYEALGQKEVADQVEVAEHFASLPYIDESKVAIWGWATFNKNIKKLKSRTLSAKSSYGGYVTSQALTLESNVIKCGIAVAPVTDYNFYNSIWTERYMRLPTENPDGYEKAIVMNKAANFRKSRFYLIHGMTDDNVHFQNAAVLEKALVKENVSFESFFYADQEHAINDGNASKHIYKLLTKYLSSCFDMPVPDDVW